MVQMRLQLVRAQVLPVRQQLVLAVQQQGLQLAQQVPGQLQ
jgi:hypothetical protein